MVRVILLDSKRDQLRTSKGYLRQSDDGLTLETKPVQCIHSPVSEPTTSGESKAQDPNIAQES